MPYNPIPRGVVPRYQQWYEEQRRGAGRATFAVTRAGKAQKAIEDLQEKKAQIERERRRYPVSGQPGKYYQSSFDKFRAETGAGISSSTEIGGAMLPPTEKVPAFIAPEETTIQTNVSPAGISRKIVLPSGQFRKITKSQASTIEKGWVEQRKAEEEAEREKRMQDLITQQLLASQPTEYPEPITGYEERGVGGVEGAPERRLIQEQYRASGAPYTPSLYRRPEEGETREDVIFDEKTGEYKRVPVEITKLMPRKHPVRTMEYWMKKAEEREREAKTKKPTFSAVGAKRRAMAALRRKEAVFFSEYGKEVVKITNQEEAINAVLYEKADPNDLDIKRLIETFPIAGDIKTQYNKLRARGVSESEAKRRLGF